MIANFAVTYRCDSRCRNCNIWRMPVPERGELTLGEIEGLFEENMRFLSGVRSIQITGGEPFLRGDLPQVMAAVRRSLPRCSFWVPTNGLRPDLVGKMTEEILEGLDGWGLGVSVSLDGIGETHEAMRGIEGSYRLALATLEILSRLRGDYPALKVSVGMTVSADNSDEIVKVFEVAKRYSADFSLRPVNFSEIYYRNLPASNQLRTTGLVDALRLVARSRVAERGLLRSLLTMRYLQGILDYLRRPGVRVQACSAGEDSMFLDPYGDVYPCIVVEDRLGNVRESTLEEIWSSATTERARKKIKEGECPGCWVECEAFRDVNKNKLRLLEAALKALLGKSSYGIR
jgi:MoaA/NifB/PqqE/SkfB family radical SAM enzyme